MSSGGCGTGRVVLVAAVALLVPLAWNGFRRRVPVGAPEVAEAVRVVHAGWSREVADRLMRRVAEAGEDELYRRIFGEDPPPR